MTIFIPAKENVMHNMKTVTLRSKFQSVNFKVFEKFISKFSKCLFQSIPSVQFKSFTSLILNNVKKKNNNNRLTPLSLH